MLFISRYVLYIYHKNNNQYCRESSNYSWFPSFYFGTTTLHFLQYNQQDAPVSQIIYSFKTLYVFRTVFPSIIRSSKLHIQQQAYVKQLLLPAASGDETELQVPIRPR